MIIGKELSEIQVFENDGWVQFCDNHPDMHIIQICFENISPPDFSFLADEYPDLATRLHTQTRLMGSFGLNGFVPWLKKKEGALCFISKEDIEYNYHFFLDCPQFKENFDSVWCNVTIEMLLVGGLSLPFDDQTTTLAKKFVSSAFGKKVYKLRTEKLHELEAPLLKN